MFCRSLKIATNALTVMVPAYATGAKATAVLSAVTVVTVAIATALASYIESTIL